MELKLDTAYSAKGKVYRVMLDVKYGFELYSIYLNGQLLSTFHSQNAALNRLYMLLNYTPEVKPEGRTINYKDL